MEDQLRKDGSGLGKIRPWPGAGWCPDNKKAPDCACTFAGDAHCIRWKCYTGNWICGSRVPSEAPGRRYKCRAIRVHMVDTAWEWKRSPSESIFQREEKRLRPARSQHFGVKRRRRKQKRLRNDHSSKRTGVVPSPEARFRNPGESVLRIRSISSLAPAASS